MKDELLELESHKKYIQSELFHNDVDHTIQYPVNIQRTTNNLCYQNKSKSNISPDEIIQKKKMN